MSDLPRTSDEVANPDQDASAQEEDQRPPQDRDDDGPHDDTVAQWPVDADRETPDSAEPGDAAAGPEGAAANR